MEAQYSINNAYQNKSSRLPEDIVYKSMQNSLLQHFILISVGHRDTEHNIGHYVERYSENEYSIIYCTKGKGWARIGNKKCCVNQGDILFSFKDSVHCLEADGETPWEIYWSCFAGDCVSPIFELLNITPENPIFHIGYKQKIIASFVEILGTMQRGYASHNLLYASSYLQQTLCSLSLYAKQQMPTEPVIESAVTLMIEHINETLTLEEISSKVGLTANYFTRIFLNKTGYTPVDYFIRLKIQKACSLLCTTSLTIREISYLLGYQDVYYFSRIFKKKIGYAPLQYRKLQTI